MKWILQNIEKCVKNYDWDIYNLIYNKIKEHSYYLFDGEASSEGGIEAADSGAIITDKESLPHTGSRCCACATLVK